MLLEPTQNQICSVVDGFEVPVDVHATLSAQRAIFDGIGQQLMEGNADLDRKVRRQDDVRPINAELVRCGQCVQMRIEQDMQGHALLSLKKVLGAGVSAQTIFKPGQAVAGLDALARHRLHERDAVFHPVGQFAAQELGALFASLPFRDVVRNPNDADDLTLVVE